MSETPSSEAAATQTVKDAKETNNIFQQEKNTVRIKCNIPSKTNKATCQLFVLDYSSSMANEWNQVKSAVSYMLTNSSEEPNFIVYNHAAKKVKGAEVLMINSSGSTSFSEAFKLIQQFINEQPIKSDVSVIFMTDGEDTSSQDLPGATKFFSAFLKSCRRNVCIHTIGYGKNHSRNFLEGLLSMGTVPGVYRYAEGQNLDTKFEELFDFLSLTRKITLTFGKSKPITVDAVRAEDKEEDEIDIFVNLTECPDLENYIKDDILTLSIEGNEYQLGRIKPDEFFTVKVVEEYTITTVEELEVAQKLLATVNPGKVAKTLRRQLLENKLSVQEKLDKYHELFAGIARGLISGTSVTSQINSLRYDHQFSKSRRARAMNKRAAANIDAMLEIEDKLESLKPFNHEEISKIGITCSLSNQSLTEVLTESKSDIIVFPLRVSRPEHAIDSPTLIEIHKFLIGKYSYQAFQDSIKFAINDKGHQKAIGGFAEQAYKKLDENVGLFRGEDGELVNACLPLYLHPDHWARVKIQIKPILGYFFTLDPLGFKSDQYLGLFMILGTMLCQKANKQFCSEYGDWIIEDFTKVCINLMPAAKKYLRGFEISPGRVRTDFLLDFIELPKCRTKEYVQNIMTIVGWEHCLNYRAQSPEHALKFDYIFTEELWRRNFRDYFRGQPTELINEWLEKLLFPPEAALTVDETLEDLPAGANNASSNAITQNDKLFADYCKFYFKDLRKAKSEEFAKKYGNDGPNTVGLLDSASTYTPRSLINYEEHAATLDAEVDKILENIKNRNEIFANLLNGTPLGIGIPGKAKWLMLIQALQYSSNSKMNSACANGIYKNTLEALASENISEFVKEIYDSFEKNRRENWDSHVKRRNDLICAKQVASCNDVFAFTGRMLKFAPTRGGGIFNSIVGILLTGAVDNKPIPLLEKKVRLVMTGKITLIDGAEAKSALSGGSSWIHCPTENARRFNELIGPDAWVAIENSMYGTWGWVYRSSDIPNRHGYHNSHPNPSLTSSFRGFNLN